MSTMIEKIEIMNFRNEITACDKLIEQGLHELKTGKILEARRTALCIQGAANRIQKSGIDLVKNDIPAVQENMSNLLSSRQSDIQHFAEALKNGMEFDNFAVTFGNFIRKTDAQILSICSQRITPGDFGNLPDYYPADPKA